VVDKILLFKRKHFIERAELLLIAGEREREAKALKEQAARPVRKP